jgi:rRNA-processing protein FCF1
MTPPNFHIDIFDEIPRTLGRNVELILPSKVQEEIERVAIRDDRREAHLALTLAKKCRLIKIQSDKSESVDDAIVRLAQDWESPVATNDQVLRKRLRSLGIPVLSMRGKGQLELHGVIN